MDNKAKAIDALDDILMIVSNLNDGRVPFVIKMDAEVIRKELENGRYK